MKVEVNNKDLLLENFPQKQELNYLLYHQVFNLLVQQKYNYNYINIESCLCK